MTLSGPDRVRAAIERDRGMQPPTEAVALCGQPDTKAMRADDPRWPGNQVPMLSMREHMTGVLASAVMCPACFRLRWSPAHWWTCR